MYLKRSLLLFAIAYVVTAFGGVSHSAGRDIFSFSFDSEEAGAVRPSQFSFYGEMLEDAGITKMNRLSKPNAAFVVADFSKDTWGVIMLSDPGLWDLTDADISVAIRSPDSFHSQQGIVGFKLIDADGRESRTRDADLHLPGRYWDIFSQHASDITLNDGGGMKGDVDLRNIVQVGLVIFDPPPTDSQAVSKFFIDDLRAAE